MANKIFLYILLYIVLAFFLTSLYYFIKRLIIAKKIETDTKAFIENLGYVTCVCGQQGSGKTTFSSGVANLYVELLQKKSNDTIINFSAMFPKFDLKEINEVIHDGFVNGKTPIQILTILREKNIVDDDFQKFLNVIPAKFYCFFVVSYFTGIRLGEALGLTKKSFKDGQLFIYQTRTNQVGMKKSVVLSPKTKTSVRIYFLADFLVKLLEEYINSLDLKEDDFLFDFGRTTIRRIITSGCEKAKIDFFHFHQLRSTESTLLYNLGIPLEDISKYLGHSSTTITSKYYLEMLNDNKKRIANILDEKFGKDFKSKDE